MGFLECLNYEEREIHESDSSSRTFLFRAGNTSERTVREHPEADLDLVQRVTSEAKATRSHWRRTSPSS
jgi:hypothetical protein